MMPKSTSRSRGKNALINALGLAPAAIALFSLASTARAQDNAQPAEIPPAPTSSPASDAQPAPTSSPDSDAQPAPTSSPESDARPSQTSKIGGALEGGEAAYNAALGEGKTLPAGVVRARLPLRFISGSSGFDAKGNKSDLGLEARAVGSGLVLEYGVTDDLSVQLLAQVGS